MEMLGEISLFQRESNRLRRLHTLKLQLRNTAFKNIDLLVKKNLQSKIVLIRMYPITREKSRYKAW